MASSSGSSGDLPEREILPRPVFSSTTGVKITSVGAAVPANEVTNEDLAALDYDDEWIVQRTGIRSRRQAVIGEATSDLVTESCRRCLENSDVGPADVDLILVATMTPDYPTPSTACVVQERLGSHAAALDVNAACAGFMYALVTGMQFVKTGAYRRVLVAGADLMSRTVDPRSKKTFPLFGDGGGAVLLEPGEEDQGLLSFTLGADGRGGPLLRMPAGGTREPLTEVSMCDGRQFIEMDGRAVFRWAVRLVAQSSLDSLRHASVSAEDVDWFIMHQANKRILDAAAQSVGIPSEKVLMNLDRFGNTSAGSIPLVLDDAYRGGLLQRGQTLLLSGFGAGLSWGAGVFRW